MEKSTNSGKRSKNFSEAEIDLLLSLVSARKDILECKKSDHVTLKDKENAWKELAGSFNESSGLVLRDWKVLKGKYENLKKTCKRRFAEDRKYMSGTGGGPYEPNIITNTDVKIKEIIGTVQLEGLPSVCDTDSTGQTLQFSSLDSQFAPISIEVPQLYEVQEVENDIETHLSPTSVNISQPEASQGFTMLDDTTPHQNRPTSVQINEPEVIPGTSQFTIKDMRKPTSMPLRVGLKRKRPSLDNTIAGKKLGVLSEEKQEVLILQRRAIEDQIQFQRKEHELKIKLLEIDIKSKAFDFEVKKKIHEQDVMNRELDFKIKTKQLSS